MDSYIEVTGSASAKERIAEYRAELALTVRAATDETAVSQATELRNQCIRALRDSGLREEELSEGGAALWRPWYWKKNVGQEASHKILLKSVDYQRILHAIQNLEPIFNNKRFSLSVNMMRPIFEPDSAAREAAHVDAVGDARAKANAIAAASELRVKGVLQVEELEARKTRTGAYGDEDWGMYAVAGAPSAGDLAEPESLEAPSRDAHYRYRVRFLVEPA